MWKSKSDECNININDLFEYDDYLLPYEKIDFDLRKQRKQKQYTKYGNREYFQRNETKFAKYILNTEYDAVVIGGADIIPPNLSKIEFNRKKQNFYNSLKIQNGVKNKLDKFLDKIISKKTLGVQIRGTDLLKMYSYTSPRYFINKIKNITKQSMFEQVLKTISDVVDAYDQIYVCSDEIKIIQMFMDKFDNVITYPKTEINRKSTEGMQDALIDWWLLGECDYIYYTHQSSFGIEAAIRRGTEFSSEIKY